VRRLFDDVAPLEASARAQAIDAALLSVDARHELAALLAAHDAADDRFDRAMLRAVHEDGLAADRLVGVYRLDRHLGRGGMGSVWAATRTDGNAEKRVAVKVIRTALPSVESVQRFLRERRILGRLEHPHIAALIDAGALADGRPWYAMEHVDGQPITEWADTRTVSVRRRLILFLQLCDALEYAHRQQVVHRDLKPSNMLVTDAGDVKLLDFGVARLLSEPSHDITITRDGSAPYTPAYASPEQQRGEEITSLSDVYALGALLYELLCGALPLALDRVSTAERIRRVSEEEPLPPSRRVTESSAAARAVSTVALRNALRGDLDGIVAMALAKDPSERYASAAALADDVRRHLDGRPILARAPSVGYRVRKFVTRHRAATVATGVLTGGAFASLLVVRAVDTRRAEAEAAAIARSADVRSMAELTITEVSSLIGQTTLPVSRRAEIIRDAVERVRRSVGRDDTVPRVGRELAWALQQLGDITGNPTSTITLGDLRGAERLYRSADSIMSRIFRADSGNVYTRRMYALGLTRLADIAGPDGRLDDARRYQERAAALYETVVGQTPDLLSDASNVAQSYIKLGDVLGGPAFVNMGRVREARDAYRRALAVVTTPPLSRDSTDRNLRLRPMLLERLGQLARASGDTTEARARLRESLSARAELATRFPSDINIQRDHHIALYLLCGFELDAGRLADAKQRCDESLAIRARLWRSDSSNASFVRSMALIHTARGNVARAALVLDSADIAYGTSVRFYEDFFRRGGGGGNDKRDYATVLALQTEIAARRGDRARALASWRSAEATMRALPPAAALSRTDSLARSRARSALGLDR
jgi:eukaryotic-like serine/threonine-protein kinase